MTSTFKTALAAAALFTAGAAQAANPWAFVSGTGSLTLSEDLQNVFFAANIQVQADGANNKASYDEATAHIGMTFTSGVLGSSDLQALTSTGSQLTLERIVSKGSPGNIVLDKALVLRNFVLDLSARTLSAELTGIDRLTHAETAYGFMPLFTPQGWTGGGIEITQPRRPDHPYQVGEVTVESTPPFWLAEGAADTFLDSLDLGSSIGISDLVRHGHWGSFSALAVVSDAPEPAACLSALAGVAVLGAARLRKHLTA